MSGEPQVGGVTKRGQRLFVAASVGILVVAVLHTVGHFSSEAPDLISAENVLKRVRGDRSPGPIAEPDGADAFESAGPSTTLA